MSPASLRPPAIGAWIVPALLGLSGPACGGGDTVGPTPTTSTGGMGLCFDGNDLYFTGDQHLWRFRDSNGDGVPDGPADDLLPLHFAEHGGHAPRRGPDGWWYVIGGNDTRFNPQHTTLATSPIRTIEAGALLRVSPDGKQSEAIAHGFRNPYDFDFNWLGDIFTYDSDVESDYFLPWYSPTRFYHVGYGAHHGWRLDGFRRSWARPDYYGDTVDILARIGRGSPTGVTCYRHFQFPPRYRNGLFALDWTFGKVYFLPLASNGSSYAATPEVFMEPLGTHGFAPTDIAVAPDGSIFISIGGRRTRGAVYRVQYTADPAMVYRATNWLQTAASEIESVLNAPQPLDAWSRTYWMPVAARLGPRPFDQAVADNRLAPAFRVRAVEILTELHGGLPTAAAAAGAQANSSFVRARVAWSLGRIPCTDYAPILLALSRDIDPMVRRCALEALADRAIDLDNSTLTPAVTANLGHPDKRIRQAAARLGTRLSDTSWRTLRAQLAKPDPQTRLTATLALLWRGSEATINTGAIDSALAVLRQSNVSDHRLQAIRLILLALGDYHLHDPSLEVYTAYEPALPTAGQEAVTQRIKRTVGALFPTGDPGTDFEAARLLAMLEDDDPATARKILGLVTDKTSPGADFHYLTVLSRLKAPPPTNTAARVAHMILSLDRKLDGLEQRPRQNWTARLTEVVQRLLARDPHLTDALVRHPDFATPGHVHLVALLSSDRYLPAARIYLAAVQKSPRFTWTGPLIELLAGLPAEQVRPLFRRQWNNLALREDLLLQLAQKPEPADRDKFLWGLDSAQPQVVRAAMTALLELPRDSSDKTPLATLRLLRRLLQEPKEQVMRAQAVVLLNTGTGQKFATQEQAADPASLKAAYQPIFDWFAQKQPALVRRLDAEDQEDPIKWDRLLKSVPWDRGNTVNGEGLFRARGCASCHTLGTALGPDLSAVTSRLSQKDLFDAILFPSRDVADPYKMTSFQTRDGLTYTGMVAFESADGVILQTGGATTVRLADTDILSREPSHRSLMPNGLLTGLKPLDIADLYAYLKTLSSRGR